MYHPAHLSVYFSNSKYNYKSNKHGFNLMAEKTVSKYLLNLEKNFASDNPVLQKAAKVFHELDQIEYDLGLLGNDETTACKDSWWPIISLIGGNSTAKSGFINSYLGSEYMLAGLQPSSHKFTVLLHSSQSTPTILPGTALDVDHRYPFYQISRKIEQQQAGEGDRINSYLELKTINSDRLKGKLFIDAPNINAVSSNSVASLLMRHTIECSDLVLIFTDAFDSSAPLVDELVETIVRHQDTNKFVYIINEPAAALNPALNNEIISSWQRKLSGLGLNTGQFIVLSTVENTINPQNQAGFAAIDQRMVNVSYDRSYRVLHSLEKSIREIDSVVIPEVTKGIAIWKDRVHFSTLLILGFIITFALFAEIQMGILDLLIDPIIGPVVLIVLIAIIVPLHILISKLQGKLIIKQLTARQKELHLMENLAKLFEKNLTFSRMLMPITEPAGWNKKTKARLSQLTDKTKELVQLLNDNFGTYNDRSSVNYSDPLNLAN
ncbi:hypothetical protein [Methylobacter sp.]|uniref:hypothetical protein n=1 Tax=Methylobacter sp. TaxID=2051955 RepID=UPI003DA61542